MSFAQITIREDGEDKLDVRMEFEPPIENHDDAENPLTHHAALVGLGAIMEWLGAS